MGEAERREFRELIGSLPFRAWICADESHHNQPGEPTRVIVDWDADGIAHCTTPGCTNTSADV